MLQEGIAVADHPVRRSAPPVSEAGALCNSKRRLERRSLASASSVRSRRFKHLAREDSSWWGRDVVRWLWAAHICCRLRIGSRLLPTLSRATPSAVSEDSSDTLSLCTC